MEQLWNISSPEEFKQVALATFRRQASLCAPYKEYLEMVGCNPAEVTKIEDIPFLPIELFKSCEVYCGAQPAEAIFTSSGDVASHHMMSSLAHYERTFITAFEHFYGSVGGWSIYALLPSYLEREGSSLIYMVEGMRRRSGGEGGGFYLYDHKQMIEDMRRDPRPKILLGVSYALLDLAESGLVDRPLVDTVVMETGGMKGRRAEMVKSELHATLERAFGVESIHSEYGMAELTSQAYSSGYNIFAAPRWMRVVVRDLADPFDIKLAPPAGAPSIRGGLNIIDLASQDSCAFIQTQDMGELYADGRFSIEGRIARSDIRGCNLLVQ